MGKRGITLISLMITIVVLLILAGVTLSLTLGEKGIFDIAKKAGENYTNAQEKEIADLENLYSQIKIATGDDAKITISMEDLKKIIKDEINSVLSINNNLGYSTTEQIVGKWVDGKPLYKKTWILDSQIDVSNTAWTDTTISIVENKIDHIIKAEALSRGTADDDVCWVLHVHTEDNSTNVMALAARANGVIRCKYFTFYYTKTTDKASAE